jgi:hypothetical protein
MKKVYNYCFHYFTHFYLLVILTWLGYVNVAEAALKQDELIDEEKVECGRPEKKPCSILDENVNVYHYFTTNTWMTKERKLNNEHKAL